MGTWDPEHPGDLTGQLVLVTGGNSGIGLEAARMLAGSSAHVILGCRDTAKGDAAAADIAKSHPHGQADVLELDLADLASVEKAAAEMAAAYGRLDVLLNNAGVMATPYRQTADGFELQLGTNHLGHFALTGWLLATLLASPAPRVVTVSSTAHRIGAIDLDNLDGARGYSAWQAYGQSKLANLLFTFELQRRADAAGLGLRSVAAHPGYAATNLQAAGPRMRGSKAAVAGARALNAVLGQPARKGAWPLVAAAAGPGVQGGDYLGPRGPFEWRGRPKKVGTSHAARDPEVARRLWETSEALTGVRYEALEGQG